MNMINMNIHMYIKHVYKNIKLDKRKKLDNEKNLIFFCVKIFFLNTEFSRRSLYILLTYLT